MKNLIIIFAFIAQGSFILAQAPLQFYINGNASSTGGNCYTITDAANWKSGSIWSKKLVDLNQPFELYASFNLGCNDANGADGITFAFHSDTSKLHNTISGGLGYAGIDSSLAIELDTYSNGTPGDPSFDHIALISAGSIDHNATSNIAGPVPILANSNNAEDCMDHDIHISWNPNTDSFKVYIDCQLRLSYQGNIISQFLGGKNQVYWGFTGATGAFNNLQKVCIDYLNLLEPDSTYAKICRGDSLMVQLAGGFSFDWDIKAGISDTNSQNLHIFPDSTTDYTVTITDNCGNTRQQFFEIVVDHDSSLNISLGTDSSLCDGETVLLDVFRPGPEYLWQNGSSSPTLSIDSTGLYWVELSNTCGTKSDSIQYTFQLPPNVDLGPDLDVCDSIWLDIGLEGMNYLWEPTGSTDQSIWVKDSGLYIITVTDSIGCEGKDSVLIDVNLSPIADFTYVIQPDSPFKVSFHSESLHADSVFWDFGNGQNSSDLHPIHIYNPSDTGQLIVTLTVFNACGSASKSTDSISVSIESDEFAKSINLYPNPSDGKIWISGKEIKASQLNIEVFDLAGRVIRRFPTPVFLGEFKQEIEFNQYPKGVYLIKIYDRNYSVTRRIIIN